MKKLCLFVVFTLFYCFIAFTQNTNQNLITDQDILSFSQNCLEIEKALNDNFMNKNPSFFEGSLLDLDGTEEILEKYGITGHNRVLKIKKIGFCYQFLKMNSDIVFSDLNCKDYGFSITQDEFLIIKNHFLELKNIFSTNNID